MSIPEIDTVKFGPLTCVCGRQMRPDDVEIIDSKTIQAICAGCHRDLLCIEFREKGRSK